MSLKKNVILSHYAISRKSIFIFLSNTGGKEITKKVHDVWLTAKVKREDLTVRDFERLVELGAFNEEGIKRKLNHQQKSV